MANTNFSYNQMKDALVQAYGSWETALGYANLYGVDLNQPENLASAFENLYGGQMFRQSNGTWAIPSYDQPIRTTIQTNPANSNTSIVKSTSVNPALNANVDTSTNKATFSLTPKSGSFVQNAMYYAAQVGNAVSAACIGIWLGKTIDSALYNANPDFWDAQGMSSLNPETWGSITAGDDSLGSTLFNWIFGIDPNSGNVQPYIDADAASYLAMWMAQQGVFATGGSEVINVDYNPNNLPLPIPFIEYSSGSAQMMYSNSVWTLYFRNNSAPVYMVMLYSANDSVSPYLVSSGPFEYAARPYGDPNYFNSVPLRTYNGKDVYWTSAGFFAKQPYVNTPPIYNLANGSSQIPWISYSILYGTISSKDPVAGIGNQDSATLPDVSTWDSLANTDTSLRSQYPNSYSNALQYDVLQPDGGVLTKTYIPVTLPDTNSLTSTNPWTDQQPTTSNQRQAQPTIDTDTSTQTIIETIIKTITQTQTLPDTDLDNPTDTGTGDTTPPVVPTGTASALWSVYHPTQAQVNSFGAWLWSDNFLDNILKIMNDPMSGIITLHKVFATPVDSGSATIVVGKLDSGVSSATVNQQYVTVDCGSVDLYEQFGNVFDYNPFTDVSLYLPFIGIVPLDTADVMRATISITYGVDVYTGACLAQVEVTRDGNTVNMYQYAGVCSVEYPLTGAQHNGLITGLLGIGTSVAGLVTGNMPMAVGGVASGIASAAKRSQSRANSFSGNAGAMGIKKPYLIISRPQTKVAATFPELQGYPTNTSVTLGECSGQVRVRAVHVDGINATEQELQEIESLLLSGVLV